MVHGDVGGRTAHENALAAFAGEPVDVVLYGHSHRPVVERSPGLLVVNPGSPTDKRRMPTFSYGILTIDGRAAQVALHEFSMDNRRRWSALR
jgi:putative phosphoesterase